MVGAGFRRNGWVVGVEKAIFSGWECAAFVGDNHRDFQTRFKEGDEFLKGARFLRRRDYGKRGYWGKRYLSKTCESQKT
jgi:hypothetical protein